LRLRCVGVRCKPRKARCSAALATGALRPPRSAASRRRYGRRGAGAAIQCRTSWRRRCRCFCVHGSLPRVSPVCSFAAAAAPSLVQLSFRRPRPGQGCCVSRCKGAAPAARCVDNQGHQATYSRLPACPAALSTTNMTCAWRVASLLLLVLALAPDKFFSPITLANAQRPTKYGKLERGCWGLEDSFESTEGQRRLNVRKQRARKSSRHALRCARPRVIASQLRQPAACQARLTPAPARACGQECELVCTGVCKQFTRESPEPGGMPPCSGRGSGDGFFPQWYACYE
jgi:hypothetical protein